MKYAIVTMAVFGFPTLVFLLSGEPIERGEAMACWFVFVCFIAAGAMAFAEMGDAGNK